MLKVNQLKFHCQIKTDSSVMSNWTIMKNQKMILQIILVNKQPKKLVSELELLLDLTG